MAMSVSFTFIESMNPIESTSSTTMRKMLVICSEMKPLSVSMSEVQRWMISPVRFLACQAKGRRSIWRKSESRIVFVSVSAPLVLQTRKAYCAVTFSAATARIASARIQMCAPR